VLRVSEG